MNLRYDNVNVVIVPDCAPVIFSRLQSSESQFLKIIQKPVNIFRRWIIFAKGNHARRIPVNAGNAIDQFPGEERIAAQNLDDLPRPALVIEFSQ